MSLQIASDALELLDADLGLWTKPKPLASKDGSKPLKSVFEREKVVSVVDQHREELAAKSKDKTRKALKRLKVIDDLSRKCQYFETAKKYQEAVINSEKEIIKQERSRSKGGARREKTKRKNKSFKL